MPDTRDLLERLDNKFLVGDGCWDWIAGKTTLGYGCFKWPAGQQRMAHTVVYELMVGPVPEGLELDHLCRNASCVRPDHLEPVTHAENCRRGESPSGKNSRKTHCPEGHPLEGDNLVSAGLARGHRECRTCKNDRQRAKAQADPELRLRRAEYLQEYRAKGRRG